MSRELHRDGGDGGAAELLPQAWNSPCRGGRREMTRRDASLSLSHSLDNYYDYPTDESIKSKPGWNHPRNKINDSG